MPSKSGSDLKVTESLRGEIASYAPKMCTADEVLAYSRENKIVAVGDVTVANLKRSGVPLKLEVVDLKTKRSEDGTFKHVEGSVIVNNPPAMLTSELLNAIRIALESSEPTRIEVEGEEDLAVIPIIYYSDLNTVVVYGVPDKGMACIQVDQDGKDYVKVLMKRMEGE